MLEAQRAVLPSQRARSHPWSPALVQAQKKKGLAASLLLLLTNNQLISPCIERRFRRNASNIDPTWEIPPLTPHNIQKLAHETNKFAKKQLNKAKKLRKQHLDRQCMDMVDTVTSADREKAIKHIIKLERIKMKHKAI